MTRRTALAMIIRNDINLTLVAAKRPLTNVDFEQSEDLNARADVEDEILGRYYGRPGGHGLIKNRC
jgi:hypothetical protein